MIYNVNRPKLKLSDKLYFSNIAFNIYQNDYWQDVYSKTSPGGKFAINIARRLNPNRYVTRDSSVWTNPWPQPIIPKYKMIDYDPNFKLDFAEVCNLVALKYKDRINQGERFAVMYSGGLDSTTIMTALIKNLNGEELKNVTVCTSITGIMENPVFYDKFIKNKFKIIDSMTYKYDTVMAMGYNPITADDGDCIFGTVFGIGLYYNWEKFAKNLSADSRTHISNIIAKHNDPDVHYTEFKDLLIAYLALPAKQVWPQAPIPVEPNFGRVLFEKFHLNAQTTNVPVNSLHDFFWWLIFNVKMLNCGVRGALYFNDNVNPETAIHKIENWYLDPLYQKWSMVNNNNGQKILGGAATYKLAAREYIYSLDNNDWYKTFKLKLESMALAVVRQDLSRIDPNYIPNARFGITENYDLLSINDSDVKDYIQYHLDNFKIDWI